MTAQRQALQTPPRLLIRTFWVLHRTAYRLTGGRFGLSQPEAGEKFGFMRLHTTGRHSRKARVAIIGYYEDGANLVTLAMNGWGEGEPSWWLNLQANSVATVDLADGPRLVRARATSGEERDRLWARFAEYPGWGDDIDALAARRSRTTAVVVLERTASTDTGMPVANGQDASSATSSTARSDSAAPVARSMGLVRRLQVRHAWLIPGIGLSLFANTQAGPLGVGLLPLLVFGIAPDLPRLVGLRRPGMLRLHNAMHQPAAGLLLLLGVLAVGAPAIAYVGALAWISHIVVGWAMGDGVRSGDGSTTSKVGLPHNGVARGKSDGQLVALTPAVATVPSLGR